MDSNNSSLAAVFIIQILNANRKTVKADDENVLPYGKYIEYKSCQINKINVVPITIIFERPERDIVI